MLLDIGVAIIIGSAAGLVLGFPAFFITDVVGSALFAIVAVMQRASTASVAMLAALGVFVFAQIAYALTLFLRARIEARAGRSEGQAVRERESARSGEAASSMQCETQVRGGDRNSTGGVTGPQN